MAELTYANSNGNNTTNTTSTIIIIIIIDKAYIRGFDGLNVPELRPMKRNAQTFAIYSLYFLFARYPIHTETYIDKC